MQKMISNIVFTKNRPLQLEAYLESLYRHFPQQIIQTYVIYKVELFDEQYELVFRKFPSCRVIREGDFHSDFLRVVNQVDTKYIMFGIDDVVFFDSVDFAVIDETFRQQAEDIFGFTLRFSLESLRDSDDAIIEIAAAGQKVYGLDWINGQTPHTRYPWELCCTVYSTDLVRKVISGTMNNNPLARKLFSPSSFLIKTLAKVTSTRRILKSFGYFFSPNTVESWNCRWCQRNADKLPSRLYFQKICATAIQVNMVNITKKEFVNDQQYSIEALNEKYKQGYRFDIDFLFNNKPNSTHRGSDIFKIKEKND